MLKKFVFILFMSIPTIVSARTYVVPPSSSTSSSVPVISDEEMEQCVILYNDMLEVERDLGYEVDVYRYNSLVRYHNEMRDIFNHYCAGKQSASAAEAARRLSQ